MYKACSRCGKLHDRDYTCKVGTNYNKYKTDEDKLRDSHKWKATTKWVKEESKYLCAVCLDQGVFTYNDLEVHHITKLREDRDKLLDLDNLICLCRLHHRMADNGDLDKNYLLGLVKIRGTKDFDLMRRIPPIRNNKNFV